MTLVCPVLPERSVLPDLLVPLDLLAPLDLLGLTGLLESLALMASLVWTVLLARLVLRESAVSTARPPRRSALRPPVLLGSRRLALGVILITLLLHTRAHLSNDVAEDPSVGVFHPPR